MSYVPGQGTNDGDILRWDASLGAWVTGSAASIGLGDVETFSVSLGETSYNPGGDPGTNGHCVGCAVIVPNDLEVTRMAFVIPQAGNGTVSLGIYDEVGNLVGQTDDLTLTSSDNNTVQIVSTTSGVGTGPISLVKENLYYFALLNRINGATFLAVQGRTAISQLPFGWREQNGNPASGMQDPVTPSNEAISQRIWLAAFA